MSTILLVEDNQITRKMVRLALESQGFAMVEAADAGAALSLFPQHAVDLVLQDLVLPDLDGFDLVRRLRGLRGGQDVPILAFSGLLSKADEAKVAAAGFDDMIAKPVEPSRLLQIVRAHLPPSGVPDTFGRGRRLLVVDDDPVQRKLAAFLLQKVGFKIDCAGDGVEALELARQLLPDVIVSDVLMPRLDGFGLCVAVRKEPALRDTPIILASNSYVEGPDHELARRAGANALVVRTPELREVVAALREHDAAATREPIRAAAERDTELARQRMRRVTRQLERQVTLYTGASQRAALLSAELSVLSGISEALAHHHDIVEALRLVMAACFDAGGISIGALHLAESAGVGGSRVIRFGAARAMPDRDLEGLLAPGSPLYAGLQASPVVVVPSDAVAAEVGERLLDRIGAASALLAPLTSKGELLGLLVMASHSVELLSDDRVVFAQAVAGQISQALALARAFAAKDRSERAARQHVTVLNSVLESIADGVVVADEAGKILVWNPAAAEILGPRPADDEVATMSRELGLVMADRVTPMPPGDAPLEAAMRGATVERVELFRRGERSPEGGWLEINARPLKDERGEVHGGVAVYRDVTVEKATQAQLMVSDRMASVGMLAAGVAHEINNPLATVMLNLELIDQEIGELDGQLTCGDLLADLKTELADAREGATRVRQIVRDLRIFSRAEEEQRAAVDIERVLESSLRMAWNEIRHRAQVVRDFAEVPPVIANESRLGQVFLNLVVNAAQSIPEGQADKNQIRVRTALVGGKVRVEITDTGAGMTPEVQGRLFTPFFTTKPAGVGTGLGLMICQRLITSIGGEITVDSEVGRGSTFRVTLPAVGEVTATEATVPAPAATEHRRHVLVVDDEPMICAAVARALRPEHEVTSLTSASEALARIRAGARFDVIVCDMMMPVMTGMDLHEQVHACAPDQARRMIFLTGGAFTPKARGFLDGIDNPRLEKPFDVDHLRAVINRPFDD
jgi:PAS domain S-box-containing protein